MPITAACSGAPDCQPFFERSRFEGSGVEEPLNLVTTIVLQDCDRFGVLYALGDHGILQVLQHLDGTVHNDLAVHVRQQGGDEWPVELNRIQRDTAEVSNVDVARDKNDQ